MNKSSTCGCGLSLEYCKCRSDFKLKPRMKDEEIKRLASDGLICNVYGHRWINTTPNICLPTHPPQYPPEQRKCDICNKSQVKTTPEWQNIK